MTRSILALTVAVGAVALLSVEGCKQSGVGDPCIPELEYQPSYNAFTLGDVFLESKSFQCQTRLCLVNHFRGRVSCPYGQQATAAPPNGGDKSCYVSGSDVGVCGAGGVWNFATKVCDNLKNAEVPAQCANRRADSAVYCSCRCANESGKTDDGANYCSCPDGFVCTQLVAPTKLGNEGLTGAYCIKKGSEYDPASSCDSCDPSLKNCDK